MVAAPAGPGGVRELVRETTVEALGLDRRILASLRDLLLHPARIVIAHVEGRAAGYVSTLKLFLFLGGLYMLCLSLVKPYSFDQQELIQAGLDPSRATSLQRMLTEHGLTVDEANDRFQGRMNAVTPFVTALALVPLALFLGVLHRGRPMRDHLTFLLVASNSVWLISLLLLPLAVVNRPAHSTISILATYVYLGIGFFAVYRGARGARIARFAAFAVVDFLISAAIGVLLAAAVFASIFFP